MKTVQCLTLLTIITPIFLLISSVQDAEANFIVQIVYFVPKDRTPDPDMGTKMDSLIKEVHQFYTDEMSRHGFDGNTFSYETDANGNAVVHQLIGKYNDAEYVNRNQTGSQEILEQFDTSTSRNILIMVLDYSKQLVCGRGGYGGILVVVVSQLSLLLVTVLAFLPLPMNLDMVSDYITISVAMRI